MKNNNLNKIVKVMASVALLSTLVACGSKNNTTNPQINAFNQSCITNCDVSGFPFFSAQTQAYKQSYTGYGYTNAFTINWSFSGQNLSGQAQGQDYNQYVSPAMNYNGKVSAAGQVNVTTALSFGFCPQIPAGQYSLGTQTGGQWANGAISGLRFIISGPVSIIASLNQAQATEYGYQFSTGSRINGNLVIEQVNGYYCQGATLSLY